MPWQQTNGRTMNTHTSDTITLGVEYADAVKEIAIRLVPPGERDAACLARTEPAALCCRRGRRCHDSPLGLAESGVKHAHVIAVDCGGSSMRACARVTQAREAINPLPAIISVGRVRGYNGRHGVSAHQ